MKFSARDHRHMAQALRLARRGLTTTDPNPRVGCVLARGDEVVGSGWHHRAGEAHAEVIALGEAGSRARGATAYVTLEPCSHQGRTAPCAEALIAADVGEVVVCNHDPFPAVDGAGIRRLEAAGIPCRVGLMVAEGEALNAGFFSRHRRGRPWIRLKLAVSLDGRTALASGESRWISSAAARADVQRWRARASAVMTGIGTALADDPSLNVRQPGTARQPLRVVVDSRWRTPPAARTLGLPGTVLVAGREDLTPPEGLAAGPAELLALPAREGRVDLRALARALAAREVNEVQVECGPELAGALLESRLLDEILVYQASCLLGDDARPAFALPALAAMAQRRQLRLLDQRRVGPDLRLRLEPQYPED